MLSRALMLLLVAMMATMPSLANACALHCTAGQSDMTVTHAASGGHCHGESPAGDGQTPADDDRADPSMTSLCAFAAAGVISSGPSAVAAPVPVLLVSYLPTPTASQIPSLPDEPPRA